MDALMIARLGLIGFAILGIAYACTGTGFLQNREKGWWEGLPQPKKIAFGSAIAASLLQTFL